MRTIIPHDGEGVGRMKDYLVTWTDLVHRSVTIPADCQDGALHKWKNGDYESGDVCMDDWEFCADVEVGVSEA